ncbi:MAG: TonB-dependent receptor [Pseudomonadota bacterium]
MTNGGKFRRNTLVVATGLACAISAQAEAQGELEEILVTATRRAQSVQDVPYNISAISGDDLALAGITDLGALVRNVPGITYVDRGVRGTAFNSGLAMRGLSVDDGRLSSPLATAPAVSTYLGETPLFANLRMTDIDRVEVLRGPQGTLYGSGSLGGTLRFIPNLPSLESTEVEIAADVSSTDNADDLNYSTDLLVNLPLGDTLALRANLGYADYAGWIDKPRMLALDGAGSPVLADPGDFLGSGPVFMGEDGTNDEQTTSARLALMWQPSDVFKATLAYQYQKDESDGSPIRAVSFPDYDEYDSPVLVDEPFEGEIDLLALDVEVDLGFATLTTSISTYESEQEFEGELTENYQQFDFYFYAYGAQPRPLVTDSNINSDEGTVVELRLASQGDGPFDWVVGAFYMDQDIRTLNSNSFVGYTAWADACNAADPAGSDEGLCGAGTTFGTFKSEFQNPSFWFDGAGPGEAPNADAANFNVVEDEVYLIDSEANFEDQAIFGELTWNLTDAWQVTGGFRYFDQTFENSQVGGAVFVDAITRASREFEESDTLFKFNTSWDFSDNGMVYLTWSEGFRRGGANALPSAVVSFGELVPTDPGLFNYEPDTVENLEIGIKGSINDRFTYTAALFDVDWEDIQLNTLVTPFALAAVVNLGEARSRGVELEFGGMVTDNLQVNLAYTYVDAELTDPDPVGSAEAGLNPAVIDGARLPNISENTVSVNAQYFQNLDNGMNIIYGLNGFYRSDFDSTIDPTQTETMDSYSLWDGFVTLEAERWSVRLFADNLFNEEGIMYITGLPAQGPRRWELMSRPRTIGVGARYAF